MRTGDWGFFPPHLIDQVHSDDQHVFRANWNARARWLFEALEIGPEYSVFGQGTFRFGGKTNAFIELDEKPALAIGQEVLVRRTGEIASVRRIDWHRNRRTFIYLLRRGTRQSTEWFFSADLQAVAGGAVEEPSGGTAGV